MEPIPQKQPATNASGVNSLVRTRPIINRPLTKNPLIKDGISTKIDKLTDLVIQKEALETTKKEKKNWKLPFKWKKTLSKSIKKSSVDKVLCFFINNKAELESPVLLPIINGNIIVYKYTIHKIDPRDILTFVHKRKFYKVLIYRVMDRRAVSTRDYGDVRDKEGSTENDEVLIKAMLTAKASQVSRQQIGKGALIVGGLVLAGVIIWIFSRS